MKNNQISNDHSIDSPIVRKMLILTIQLKAYHPRTFKKILNEIDLFTEEEIGKGLSELYKFLTKSTEDYIKDFNPGFLN